MEAGPKLSERREIHDTHHAADSDDDETWLKNMQIFAAIRKDRLDKLKALLEDGVKTDITDKNNKDNTPLHCAVQKGKTEIVAELLNAKWNTKIHLKNSERETPLDIANQKGHLEIIQLLQKHQADRNGKNEIEKTPASLSDLDAKTEKEISNSLIFQRTKGAAGIEGQLCEINLSILLLLKGTTDERVNKFFLASNMVKADKFDDIVFKYQNKMGKSKTVFLQAKHKADEKANDVGDKGKKQNKGVNLNSLLSDSESGDFSLNKYFISYRKIKQHFKDNTDSDDPVFSGNFEDSEFILYTNAAFEYARKKCIKEFKMDENDFLHIPDSQGKYYQLEFNSDEKERIFSLLKNSSDCRRLAKALAGAFSSDKGLDMQKDIFQSFHQALQKIVIKTTADSKGKLSDYFFSHETFHPEGDKFRNVFFEEAEKVFKKTSLNAIKQELQNKEITLSSKFWAENCGGRADLPNDEPIGENEVKDFLAKFKLYAFQPNERAIEGEIKEISKEFFKIEQQDIDSVYADVEYQIRNWWQAKNNYLTKDNTFFETAARVSVQFDIKEPVAFFTGRAQELKDLHEILQEGGEAVISQTVSITGLGGVGKSELARKYLSENKKYYDSNVIWINADNSLAIDDSFRRLAQEKLGISTCDEKGHQKDITLVTEDVYGYFAKRHRKSIFVFDNAEKYKIVGAAEGAQGIDKFLPHFSSNKPFVLITSRDQEWGKIKHLPVGVFTDKEAIDFIKKALKGITQIEEDDAQRLAEELDHLPLALSQAVAYISVENQNFHKWSKDNFTISSYLEQFKNHADELLRRGSNHDRYSQTVLTTWKMTQSKIEAKTLRGGDTALKMLYVMGYLAPRHIPVDEIFDTGFGEELRHSAVELLDQYSMVQLQGGKVNIHRLVQQVTRIELEAQRMDEEIIKRTFTLLMSSFPSFRDKTEDIYKKRRILPHFEAFLLHIDDLFKNKPEERKQIEIDHHREMLIAMADGYDLYPERQKPLLERALRIEENYHGPDHFKLATTLSYLGGTYGALGETQKSKRLLERALEMEEKHYGPDHVQVAVALNNVGNTYGALGDGDKSIQFLERALEINERYYGPNHFAVGKTLINLGNAYGAVPDTQKSKQLLERALPILENYYGPDHYAVAKTLRNLGIAHGVLGNVKKSAEFFERVLKIVQNFWGPDHWQVAVSLVDLGSAYGLLGDGRKSKQLLERAEKLLENNNDADSCDVAKIFSFLGNAYVTLGDGNKSILFLERALTMKENAQGPDHWEVALILRSLSDAYIALGNAQKSTQLLERALKIKENHYGNDHLEVAFELHKLGKIYGDMDDAQKSKQFLERALQIKENYHGRDHFEVVFILVDLGKAYTALGDVRKSKDLFERAVAIEENHNGPDHFEVAQTLTYLGNAYLVLDNAQKSKQVLQRALPILEDHYGSDHIEVAKTRTFLGNAYVALGDAHHSKQLFQRALPILENYYGPDHFLVATTILSLGNAYATLGDMENATPFLLRALTLLENTGGLNMMQSLQNL